MNSAKLTNIGYWVTTAITALVFGPGGIPDLIQAPPAIEFLKPLGYPAYFASILGAWKLLGAVVLLAPRLPRLKEWAYAGILFDLTGAAISHAATGGSAVNVFVPLLLAAIAVVSWSLRPQTRKLRADAAAPSEGRRFAPVAKAAA